MILTVFLTSMLLTRLTINCGLTNNAVINIINFKIIQYYPSQRMLLRLNRLDPFNQPAKRMVDMHLNQNQTFYDSNDMSIAQAHTHSLTR